MEYKGYHAKFEFDENDRIYVGQVEGVKDDLFFHGATLDELEREFHNSVDNYLIFKNENR